MAFQRKGIHIGAKIMKVTKRQLYRAQAIYISNNYGPVAAVKADYGLIVGYPDAPLLEIATRVPGHGVLCSIALNSILNETDQLQVHHDMIDISL